MDSRRFKGRTLLWKGGCRVGGGWWLSERMGSEPTPAMPARKSLDSAYICLSLRITFRSHVEKTCDALSLKTAWFLKVIFTGISAPS